MKPRHKRTIAISAGLFTIVVATLLILNALKSNISLFITPSEVAAGNIPQSRTFRIGGLVKKDSLKRDGLVVSFKLTDLTHDVIVNYQGILPDLFSEGKGAVAQGKIGKNKIFIANEVLAKHDENYMPREAQYALEAAQKNKKETQTNPAQP